MFSASLSMSAMCSLFYWYSVYVGSFAGQDISNNFYNNLQEGVLLKR